jgi:hypothetical protein
VDVVIEMGPVAGGEAGIHHRPLVERRHPPTAGAGPIGVAKFPTKAATLGGAHASGRAAVTVEEVAIIAVFVPGPNSVIATARGGADNAIVGVDLIAVVAGFLADEDDAVAAKSGLAIIAAGVGVNAVSVVTFFGAILHHPVTAKR